jgi:hypothetical protein
VNEWRSAHPVSPVPSAMDGGGASPLELIAEPVRSAEFLALMELEDVSEDGMNEQERIAYEMRGGDSGPLAAASLTAEDGEDDFGPGGEDDFCDNQRFVTGYPPMQGQPQQQLPTTPGAPSVVPGNARARAQSLSIPCHLQQQQQQMQHQFAAHQQQQQQQAVPTNVARFQQQQQLQINTQQAQAAAASLIPSPYGQLNLQQQQEQYAALQQQQHQLQQQQAMQMTPAGFPHMAFIPPSFDAIAAAAANGFSNGAAAAQPQTPAPSTTNEQDAAKLAAWNAHLFSTAITAQQQQRDQQRQQQRQFGVQFQTPPPSSDGPTGPFGANNQAVPQQQQLENQLFPHLRRAQSEDVSNLTTADDSMDATGASTPSSHASSVAPSLSLSLSSLSSISSPSGAPSSAGGSAHPSALSTSLASPLHSLSLSNAQQDALNVFAYGGISSAGANWGNVGVSGKNSFGAPVVQTPPITVGGGGGGGFHQYPMMSMFI